MRIIILLAFLLFAGYSKGQEFFLKHYTTEEGLPSNQIYDVLQDSQGYIWIATDAGVSRFDGYKIESFSKQDGLSDNSIVQIRLADDGTVWFMGFNKTFTLYKDSFSLYPFNHLIEEKLQKQLITSFYPSIDSDTLFLGLNTTCDDEFSGVQISNGKILSIRSKNETWIDFKKEIFHLTNCPKSSLRAIQRIDQMNNVSAYTTAKSLVIKKEQSEFEVNLTKRSSKALLIDNDQNIWVGSYQGLFLYPKNVYQEPKTTPWTVESKQAISSITQSNDGSIWFGTFSNGLYQIPSTALHFYTNLDVSENNDFLGVSVIGNQLATFNRNNHIITLKEQNNKLVNAADIALNDNITQLYNANGKLLALTENQFDNNGSISPFKGLCVTTSSEKNTFWVGGLYSFSKYQNGSEVFNSIQIDFQERVNSIVEVTTDNLWLGTLDGLYHFVDGNITRMPGTEAKSINAISIKNSKIYIGTQGSGVGIIDGSENNQITWITETEGLSSNFTNCFLQLNGNLIIGGKSGLNVLRKNGSIIPFNRFHGLGFEHINDIQLFKKWITVATTKGLVLIDSSFVNSSIPEIKVEISFNGRKALNNGNFTFDYNQQNLNIEFKAFDFFQQDQLMFHYKLNSDTAWQKTNKRTIRYESLPPGDYTFEVKAQNRNGVLSKESSTLSFSIKPPYYQTTWFYALIAIIVLLVFYLILKWQLNISKKRLTIENELSALKIKALSAQMNPHFIFNSLNSIQNFLIDSDLRKSNKYLTKFAKLMRLVLNNSDKTFVPIKDVLSSLELYMELEKLRFNDKFEYKFNIDPKIEIETTHIPSMLIQPFIENSILHGILPKQEKGKIEVSIKYISDSSLLCTIEDNGVGREFHKDKIGKKHKSQGLRITKERLEVFKQLFKDEFKFSFHDLKDEFDKPKGTKVELSVPSR